MRSQITSTTTGLNPSTVLTDSSLTIATTISISDEEAKAIVKISEHTIDTLLSLTNALKEAIQNQEDQKQVNICRYRLKVLNWLKLGFDADTQRIQGDRLEFPKEIGPDQLIDGLNWLQITNDWHVWKRALTIYFDKHNEGTQKSLITRDIIAKHIIPLYMWSPAQKKS
jgi:hypothetical protein